MLFWAFLFSFLIQIEGARFLGIFPYQVHSSKLVYVALTEELANRGHHLTVISPFPKSSNSSNIEHIQFNIPRPASTGPPKNIYQWTKFFETGVQECETILQLREIQEIIHSTDRTYDAIILQALRSECMLGFGHKYKAPTIQICSFGGIVWMRDWVGSPNPFSYAPVTVLASSDRMDFWERMLNTLINFYWTIVQNYYIVPMHDEVVRKYFDNVSSIPSLLDMLRNTSLLMDLQEFIDNSSEGVIYFSIGSSVKCTNFEKSKINAFLEAFSKIKQRVLWKYETDYLPGKSENVKISKWLPQNDILGHPNVRLFISHGGLLSMQEALNSGVPIVGIPIYADQHQNVIRAQIGGYGITLAMLNFILLWHLLIQVKGSKFLGIFPFEVKSSKHVYAALTEELANRGHLLTVISPFPKSSNSSNIEHIQINIPRPPSEGPPITIWDFTKFWKYGIEECGQNLQQPEIQDIIHSKIRSYDAIILQSLRSECMFGFGHKFNAPVIQICSYAGSVWMRERVGSPNPYAYAPYDLSSYSDRMNFWERVLNTLRCFYWSIAQDYYFVPRHEKLIRKYFSHLSSMPPLWKMVRNTSLLMINSHFSMNYPRPEVPNLIEVGGIHLKPPKELSQTLWLIKTTIGHPNVRLFISHGGLLSMQEALYSGVPVLGIPIYADQHLNVKKAQISGYAVQLDYDNVTTESVLWAIKTALLPR
ncbi:hypothetical protein C0J52_18611 [Blattella germanica]|nr:hypothetical protein C0J52_18611 [Blattella germanica]